jgi:hypothetical protein
MTSHYSTQNELLMKTLLDFYKGNNHLDKMLDIINGKSKISLRIIDWFATNYAKKYYTVYDIKKKNHIGEEETRRFKVYMDYKQRLDGYSKRRFDPFCRWERVIIPYDNTSSVQTTLGQLNFFKWVIEHNVLDYVEKNYKHIENDMNKRNSTAKRRVAKKGVPGSADAAPKTRKKREELSISAAKTIKKEEIQIVIKFD